MDITRWLEGLGLEQYEHAFREGDVDAEVLPELMADDLIALGVTSIGHRRKLLAAIAALRPTTQLTAETTAAGATTFSHAHTPVADPVSPRPSSATMVSLPSIWAMAYWSISVIRRPMKMTPSERCEPA